MTQPRSFVFSLVAFVLLSGCGPDFRICQTKYPRGSYIEMEDTGLRLRVLGARMWKRQECVVDVRFPNGKVRVVHEWEIKQ